MALKSKPISALRSDIPTSLLKEQPDMVKVNIAVPRELRAAWKFAALQRGVTLEKLVTQAMQPYSQPLPGGGLQLREVGAGPAAPEVDRRQMGLGLDSGPSVGAPSE